MRSQTEKTNFCKIVVPRTYLTAKECYKIKGGYTNRSIQSTRPFLISGVGRSGTTFIASLYQQVGLDIHHDHFKDCRETIQCPGRDGAVSWPQAFSDQRFHTADNNSSRQCSLSSFTWMVPNGIYFDHIIHVVRDPIKTIDSRWNKGNVHVFRDQTLCNTVAQFSRKSKTHQGRLDASLRFTMHHWSLWNLFIETQAIERFRLEDFTPELAYDLFARYGTSSTSTSRLSSSSTSIIPSVEQYRAITNLNKNHGHTQHSNQTDWKLLKQLDIKYTGLIQKMALRYGYDIHPSQVLDVVKDPTFRESCRFRDSDGRWQCRLMKIN